MTWKHLVLGPLRSMRAGCARLRGLGRSLDPARGLVVLTYHRVLPSSRMAGDPLAHLAVDIERFRRDMDEVRRCFEPVRLDQGLERVQYGPTPGRPMLAVTFDDGFADNFRLAAPILDERGIAGTFFPIAGLVDTPGRPWYVRAALAWNERDARSVAAATEEAGVTLGRGPGGGALDLRRWLGSLKALDGRTREAVLDRLGSASGGVPDELDRIMTTAELRSLVARGHEIGSHSMTHPILPREAPECLDREVRESKRALEAACGVEIQTFCYPNGDHDDGTVAAVRAAGYRRAVTTRPGICVRGSDPFRCPRIEPRSGVGARGLIEGSLRAQVQYVCGSIEDDTRGGR